MAVEQYRQWIQQLLLERAERKPSFVEIETQAVLDTVRDRYLSLSPIIKNISGFSPSPHPPIPPSALT
ncbi:MAG: element excision factor XisI family protein [Cyanobacteriota bacterium]|nr:element excision factor XisI family protein [Cyanobacteriota bacterium]